MTNTAKHTPGPWYTTQNSCAKEKDKPKLRVSRNWRGAEQVIAVCEEYEGEANARLIAAAPELLEALKAAREMFYTLGDRDTQESKDCFALYEICDAALAKADPSSNNSK